MSAPYDHSRTVHVENIAAGVSEEELRNFFSFCGAIKTVSFTPRPGVPEKGIDDVQSATITFEKDTAAKTAALLDETPLRDLALKVASAKSLGEIAGVHDAAPGLAKVDIPISAEDRDDDGSGHISQEDKPRARVLAEMLAKGHQVKNVAIDKALQLDKSTGLSQKLTTAFSTFDQKTGTVEKTRAVDEKYQVTNKVSSTYNSVWNSVASFFDNKIGHTATGQKVVAFYDQTMKDAAQVYEESKRLAALEAEKAGNASASASATSPSVTTDASTVAHSATEPATVAGTTEKI